MSHRDLVAAPPPGFEVLAGTPTCRVAAMSAPDRRLYGVQFHPEVVHTPSGREILSNFIFGICGCVKDWNPAGQIEVLEPQIRETAGGRNVFFFVSGGVDSTVAFTLCLKSLGPERVHGAYVDTGLMREGETEFVRCSFAALGARRIPRGGRRAAVSRRSGARRGAGAEAPHHRRGVRARAGAGAGNGAFPGRRLDSRPGHDLSRHHRIRRNASAASPKPT